MLIAWCNSITETAPYMHDGVFKTLEEVVDFLDQGGGHNSNLSPLVKPLGLTQPEKTDLIAFLKGITGGTDQVRDAPIAEVIVAAWEDRIVPHRCRATVIRRMVE